MTTQNVISILQMNNNNNHSNTHLVFSNQDYRKLFASNVPSSRFEYIENKGVAIKGKVNGAILETKVPIHESKKYHLICEVELLNDDGDGSRIFIGHDTLDKNFNSLRTDEQNTYNYSLASGEYLTSDLLKEKYEAVVSGFNSTDDGNNYKFDPSGSYFNIVFYTRYDETDNSSVKLLIKRLEIKEFSSIIEHDNGNVGIGTTSPSTVLTINPTDYYLSGWLKGIKVSGTCLIENDNKCAFGLHDNGTIYFLQNTKNDTTHNYQTPSWSNTASMMIQHNTGNVGIGTTTPSAKLDVNGDCRFRGEHFFGNSVRQMLNLWGTEYGVGIQSGTLYLRSDRNFAFYEGGTHNDNELNAGSGGHARLVIRGNTGNVGIGTTSPSEKLEVNGNIKCDELISNGFSLLSVDDNGDEVIRNIITSNTKDNIYGTDIAIQGGGNTIVGSGESATEQLGKVRNDGLENLYLTSDTNIHIITNSQSGSGSNVATFNSNGLYVKNIYMQEYTLLTNTTRWYPENNQSSAYWYCFPMNDGNSSYVENLVFATADARNHRWLGLVEDDAGNAWRMNDFTGSHRCVYDERSIDPEKHMGLIVVSKGDYNTHISRTFYKNLLEKGSTKIQNVHQKKRGFKIPAEGQDAITIADSLPVVQLCKTENSKAVFGVVGGEQQYFNKKDEIKKRKTGFGFVKIEDTYDKRIEVHSLGEGGIWVCNINGNLENGDYITSSSIPGYGMKQDENILKNYTVAKITCDCDFDETLYPVKKPKIKIVEKEIDELKEITELKTKTTIVYDETLQRYIQKEEEYTVKRNVPIEDTYDLYDTCGNVIGTHKVNRKKIIYNEEVERDICGNVVWITKDELGNPFYETKHKLRYLDSSGNIITKQEYENISLTFGTPFSKRCKGSSKPCAYIAAFVGCTYHCG